LILPNHLQTLAPGDTDFSTRWSLIKGHFSRAVEKGEHISQSYPTLHERGHGSAIFGNISFVTKRTSTVTGLCPLEPGKPEVGATGGQLASFQFPCVQAARNRCGGFGWKERLDSCGRGVTRAMRFPSFTASYACCTPSSTCRAVALANPFSYGVDLLTHALGPETLFDADFSLGRELLAMLAFVLLPLAIACRRFSQAPVFESLARVFTALKRH
jgi:hypothetical protein